MATPLRLVFPPSEPPPWYARPWPSPVERRHGLEQQRTRLLAHAVGEHLPYELVLRVAQLEEQLGLGD